MKLFFLTILLLCAALSCKSDREESYSALELSQAVLWAQHSAEYKALTYQAYNNAKRMLDIALKDKKWTAALEQEVNYSHLPPAVILDVDETVLDNSPYEGRLIKNNAVYEKKSWIEWGMEKQALAIKGAVDFCNYAVVQGVTPIFITNRRDTLKSATLENLQKQGFPASMQTLITRSGPSDKGERRETVADSYRILLLIGDSGGDFASELTHSSSDFRSDYTQKMMDNWGSKWIVLPNPSYGDWDGALYNYQYQLPSSKKQEMKLSKIKTN